MSHQLDELLPAQICLCGFELLERHESNRSPPLCVTRLRPQVFHQLDELLPASNLPLDDLLAVVLLLFFGITTLKVCIWECELACVWVLAASGRPPGGGAAAVVLASPRSSCVGVRSVYPYAC